MNTNASFTAVSPVRFTAAFMGMGVWGTVDMYKASYSITPSIFV